MSRHAALPVPCAPPTLPPRLCARVHAQLLCNSSSRAGHWCREVCFDFKSLPSPAEDIERRSLFASAAIHRQRAPFPSPAGPVEGREKEGT